MNLEIDYHYARISALELKAYNLRSTLTDEMSATEWDVFEENLSDQIAIADADKLDIQMRGVSECPFKKNKVA